jgi:FAD dependent oxidoreductase TIGR03364
MFDDAVVGAGILGLAHACQLAKRGRRVVVVERRPRAEGASIRNFGMLWPIGQPHGEPLRLATRSLAIWLDVLRSAGIWHEAVGSLHLAYHDDERQVIDEFLRADHARPHGCEFWDAHRVRERSPWTNPHGLRGALWSPGEVCVDPRQVVAQLPDWLHRTHGVDFRFGVAALGFERGVLRTSAGDLAAKRLFVCSGDDFLTLFPDDFAATGQVRCKLQMMRSQPFAARLGPMLAAGLTLLHYRSFADCPSLPALRQRLERELPRHLHFGIHVMASQHAAGELTLGDSHEYGDAIEIFDKEEIDALILDYLRRFLTLPDLRIASRWHGVYVKHPSKNHLLLQPAPGVVVSTGVGGAGMTLSFGVAEKAVRLALGESDED